MKEKNEITKLLLTNPAWRFKIARLVNLALIYVSEAPPSENIAALMRFIEIFTNIYRTQPMDVATSIYKYLVSRNYYGHIRKLCDSRIPPIMSEITKPPTPMAEILYGLILIPFSLLDSEENQFCKDVLLNLTESFLAEEFSEQVDYFIVPALAHEKSFPYSLWNKVLSQNGQTQKTPWLLYSFLKLGQIHLAGQNPNFDVHSYLNVLSDLTGAILKTKTIGLDANEESDSDDEDAEKNDSEMTDLENNRPSSVISRSVTMLNDPGVVSSLVSAIEKSHDEALALTALCKLCHNLLLSGKRNYGFFFFFIFKYFLFQDNFYNLSLE